MRPLLLRLFGIHAHEVRPVVLGFSLFFLTFACFFLLRPVRETMGIVGGVNQLQWLFTGTFLLTLAVLPLYGWLASRVARRRILAWTFGFFVSNLLGFALLLSLAPDSVWAARSFYMWMSMANMLAISVAWSVCADLFVLGQAKRLFALLAAGASLGGLTGPLLAVVLVGPLGHAGLLLLSAGLLAGAMVAAAALKRWRDAQPASAGAEHDNHRPLGGNPFAGALDVLRSPYLLGIAVYVLLLASVTTFLYFEQARLVELSYPDRADQTRVFGILDAIVQSLAILTQLFLTGRIALRFGIGVLLTGVPLAIVFGFLWLATAPVFLVLAVVMVLRRAGEYALIRPGREMLFTSMRASDKYKSKNFIDTVVYRFGDVVSAWFKTLVDALAQQPALAALVGAGVSLAWAGSGWWLARRQPLVDPPGTTLPAAGGVHSAAAPVARGTS